MRHRAGALVRQRGRCRLVRGIRHCLDTIGSGFCGISRSLGGNCCCLRRIDRSFGGARHGLGCARIVWWRRIHRHLSLPVSAVNNRAGSSVRIPDTFAEMAVRKRKRPNTWTNDLLLGLDGLRAVAVLLVLGFLLTFRLGEAQAVKMVTPFLLDLPAFGSEKLITKGLGIPFLMQAWWSFCLCCLVFVAVSLATPRPAPEKVDGLTWDHPLSMILHSDHRGWPDPRAVAALLLAIMAGLYWIFR